MKRVKLFFSAHLIASTFLITTSCSQTTAPVSSTGTVFTATTPYDNVVEKLLGISPDNKYEMMKWNLTLYRDTKTLAPSTYKLTCVYGLPKQGTRGFMEGAKAIELKGKWTINKGTYENAASTVYTLNTDNSPVALSFMQPDQNLLHLLDGNKRLMIGNGAWSYTLNRVDPLLPASVKSELPSVLSQHTSSDSTVIGVFDGRTPCNNDLLGLNGISIAGCQITKCRLILYQDSKTRMPTSFQLLTVYVGKGDTRYTTTGKWKILQGSAAHPDVVIYQLETDAGKTQSLSFLKADDNILWLLDKDGNFLVGDEYTSYTLNRSKK